MLVSGFYPVQYRSVVSYMLGEVLLHIHRWFCKIGPVWNLHAAARGYASGVSLLGMTALDNGLKVCVLRRNKNYIKRGLKDASSSSCDVYSPLWSNFILFRIWSTVDYWNNYYYFLYFFCCCIAFKAKLSLHSTEIYSLTNHRAGSVLYIRFCTLVVDFNT